MKKVKTGFSPFMNRASALLVVILVIFFSGCNETKKSDWNKKYDFIYNLSPIVFHYDHGILAGSYPGNRETTEIHFNDVSKYLGHVCLCGAGGYQISKKAINLLNDPGEPLERGEFTLVSSRDHTISDVIAYVLGCSRRNDPGKNQLFVDPSIEAPKREYHYYIGYAPTKKAVHVVYRKHLLIGNQLMDSLWKVELAYEEDPATVSKADAELYQNTMFRMVSDLLLDRKEGLIAVEPIDYDAFRAMLEKLKAV